MQLTEREQRWLAMNPSVKVLVDDQLLPFSYRDGKSQLRGLSLDVLQRVSDSTGLQFDVQAGGTIQKMTDAVREGKAHLIAGVPRSPALERHLQFSRPFLKADRVLVTRDGPAAPMSLDHLAGQRLAMVWGSAMAEVVQQQHPGIEPLIVNGPVAALRAVAGGQAAAAVLTQDDARPLISRWYPGRLNISVSLAGPPAQFSLASGHGSVDLLGIINKALLSLEPEEMEHLVRRWRNSLVVADGVWPRYRDRILLGFGVALALLLLALMWIRYLRRLQVELRRAKREADAANQAKTRFLATMSHEIRTPLHAVMGMLELAQHKAEQGVLDPLAIEVATDAARGVLELIGDILDITRIEAGYLRLAPQRVRLREQVARVVQLFEQQARGKGLELHLQADGAVDTEVMLDPLRFKQVLANLLSNAIKFTHRGHVSVHLRAVPADDRLTLYLRVQDTGLGIAQAELAELGQPFRQASNQQQSPRCSAGLGLGISASLCEMMGGRLRLYSELGVGTEVNLHLELPVAGTSDPAPPTPATALVPEYPRLRVLVVDDYPANRLLLAQQLAYLGHESQLAQEGAQALRLWQAEHFDVVITDCHMPSLDGCALARAIREVEQHSPRRTTRIIGLTANALESERRRCMAAGMDDCVFKPLGLGALAHVLNSSVCAVGPAGATTEAALDVDHLRRLVGQDDAALSGLLGDLLTSTRHDLCQLQEAQLDPQALSQLVHRVKGGARIAHARHLLAQCERLEQCCTVEPVPTERLRHDAQAMREAMHHLEQHLQQLIAQGGAG